MFSFRLPLLRACTLCAIATITALPQAWAQDAAQLKQLSELVKKIGADAPKDVTFKLDKKLNGFEVRRNGKKVSVRAGTLNELPAGYGYYLKHGKNVFWSWSGTRSTPVAVSKKTLFKAESPWQWRYAYNYCTLSYTSAVWGEKAWLAEIDRMALNGINKMLVQAGLEKVWQLTLTELGYPKEKITAFIPNPAFAAWWNMGNLEGHGGPITQGQIDREAALGKFIVTRMCNFGIDPILQGFVGLVPHDFGEHCKLKGVRMIPQGKWVDGFVRPAVLDPTCPAFPQVANVWYKNLQKVYGIKAKAFGGDLFHEGGRSGGVSVKNAATAIQDAMQAASPGSVWVLQAWHANPSAELLSGLDKDKCIVLSLCKNMATGTEGGRHYHGAPWVWCELSNFGGNHGLYGSLQVLGRIGKMASSSGSDKLVGIGLIPEGTEVNPVTYDLLYDRLWMPKETVMDDNDIATWIKGYTLRRYGKSTAGLREAWQILERSIYRPTREQEGCTESILCARPARNVQKASTWASGKVYWDPKEIQKAFEILIKEGESDPQLAMRSTYRWDLCDIGRQFMADLARPQLEKAMAAYDAGDKASFEKYSSRFLDLITSTDSLLSTHSLWHFGRMYQMALAKGKNNAERKNTTQALKTLITSWSGKPGKLNDYAHRQLGGLMKDYYLVRWTYFFDAHKKALAGNAGELNLLNEKINNLLIEWPYGKTNYKYNPKRNNSLAEARKVFDKFSPIADELFGGTTENNRPWTLRDGAKILSFDVSDDIMQAGTFAATFKRNSGKSTLVIKAVRLYEGDKLVASDVHDGFTGKEDKNNTYKINVRNMRTNLDAYTLKAEVSGVPSNDVSGVLIFRKTN